MTGFPLLLALLLGQADVKALEDERAAILKEIEAQRAPVTPRPDEQAPADPFSIPWPLILGGGGAGAVLTGLAFSRKRKVTATDGTQTEESTVLTAGYTTSTLGRRPTGAIPTPRHRLAGATPYRIVGDTPASWIWIPRKLSYWDNNQDGDCVTAEEAFAKACSGIFISDAEVIRWASAHGVLNGANLDQVLDWMFTKGFEQDGNIYNVGAKSTLDYTNAAILNNAISKGPVKVGCAAGQLQGTVGSSNGWFGVGFTLDNNQDHCTTLCGYGTMAWLAQQLGVTVPAGIDGNKLGYAFFTWDTIGIIDVPSMIAIVGEAWSRAPTTIIVGTNPPTPDVVFTPPPPTPPPPLNPCPPGQHWDMKANKCVPDGPTPPTPIPPPTPGTFTPPYFIIGPGLVDGPFTDLPTAQTAAQAQANALQEPVTIVDSTDAQVQVINPGPPTPAGTQIVVKTAGTYELITPATAKILKASGLGIDKMVEAGEAARKIFDK